MAISPDSPVASFDVIVIGAGPAGCEAAIAAGRAGAKTLCLTINLDTVGLHPASPLLATSADDPRRKLLDEIRIRGGVLPTLFLKEGVALDQTPKGEILIDRRQLGLAYKEQLETSTGVEPRQALATSLVRAGKQWLVLTKFGEKFSAPCIVIATGTFLQGVVEEAGVSTPGGRHGEIPANALASCLKKMGFKMKPTTATSFPRLDCRNVDAGAIDSKMLPRDGSALKELFALSLDLEGNRSLALSQLRSIKKLKNCWIMRPGYNVHHLILAANQVGTNLEAYKQPGLFFAGRVAGSCNFIEAAALGLIAGRNAAAKTTKVPAPSLTNDNTLVKKLCDLIAHQQIRPVTVRKNPPGC